MYFDMYIQVQLEKRPIAGVMLGMLLVGMFFFGFGTFYREYRGFGQTPRTVDLKTVPAPPELKGMWVRVTQPLQIHCTAYVEKQYGAESLLFGTVKETDYMAEIEGAKRLLLLKYDGKMGCQEIVDHEMVGVLYELNATRRKVLQNAGLEFPGGGDAIAFCGTCGPAQSRKYMLLSLFMPVLGIFAIARYWPMHRAQARQAERVGVETGALTPPPPIG